MKVACKCGREMKAALAWHGYECPCGFTVSIEQLLRSYGAPTQEADGHFRGCARLGKCRCPANAPRDVYNPHADDIRPAEITQGRTLVPKPGWMKR